MRRIIYYFLTIFMFSQVGAFAQVRAFDFENQRPLTQEQKLDSLIMLDKKLNALNSSIPGYRLNIYFEAGNYSKAKAIEVKNTFDLNYPEYKAYISFSEPYYRVRVGDFRTKIEAVGFLKKILKTFPNAFEVKDMISLNNN